MRRRHLTILFSDLSDSTRLADAMEAEDYADLLGRLRRAYQEVIPKHGGTIVRIQGDGLLAIFGYPDAGENDGRRATETALQLHAVVREFRFERPLPGARLGLHSGIHAGLVLLDEGDLVRGRFELLGNAPNIAARLSDAAEKDEILVSEATLGAESHFFQTGGRQHLEVKGAAEPIGVYRILGRAPATTRFEARARRGLVPLVDRKAEMRALEETLQAAAAGEPAYVALSAGPGLGKTRLADEFLGRAAGKFQVHRGHCESYLNAEPLQPFLQMLRSLCRLERGMSAVLAAEALGRTLRGIDPALERHRGELLRALSLLSGEPDGARATPDNTAAALRDLFAALAASRAIVLFIDDWQWADDATRQVLGAIRRLERCRLMVLLATRGIAAGDAEMSDARVLDLAPFSESEAAETVSALLPSRDPFVVAEIHRYSGGNPLFIEELCHSAAHDSAEHRFGRARGGAAWLNGLIESRVARLPAAQAELLRAAAVIGNVVPAWLLEGMTGRGEHDPLVQGLAEQDFLFPGEAPGWLRFKHGITRDVIYDSVGLHQRRAMHLRIAESLLRHGSGSEAEPFEALAYHYGAGGRHAEAARYAELAGDKAMAAAALDRAQAQYRAALAALDLLEPTEANRRRRSQIVQRFGMACVFDPAKDQLDVLQRAAEFAAGHDDAAGVAGAEYWLGYLNYGLGESRLAIGHCERALAAARRAGDEALGVQITATLGQARAAAGDYAPALAQLDAAIAVRRAHRTGPAIGSAYSLACKASVLGDRGSFAEAHACFDEALDALRGGNKVVEGSVLCWRSAVCLWQGRWEDARQSAAEAEHIAERVKSLYVYGMSRALGAYANWILRGDPQALGTIDAATQWLEARDKRLFISLNYGWLAEGMVAAGRFGEARAHASRALKRARRDDRLGEAMACRALARAAAGGHARRPPERYLALAMQAARDRGARHETAATELCAAEIELARGNRAAALPLLERAMAGFEAMDMAWHLAQAERLRQ
ncbi:MAG TPA: adenylate/guanylate cyclase domain-containing protein [Burkholderiales bacterium]